jgi:glutamate formiminotransferase
VAFDAGRSVPGWCVCSSPELPLRRSAAAPAASATAAAPVATCALLRPTIGDHAAIAPGARAKMPTPTLLAVPNVSEGRDAGVIANIARAFVGDSADVRLLDRHSDPDHDRSVFTLAGQPGALVDALLRGAAAVVRSIDVVTARSDRVSSPGQHPHVGALDVAPMVYLERDGRGAACAAALVVADRVGLELDVPVFLYGELADGRTRAELRRGGAPGLARRMAGATPARAPQGGAPEHPLRPDFGPPRLHRSAGATLIAAREPLVAFNVCLEPRASAVDARAIAARIREGGAGGLRGVRAIGIALGDGRAQVSMNIERPLEIPLARVIEAVARHARIAHAELVGLAPAAALEGFPEDVPMPGFDPERHVIENALRS